MHSPFATPRSFDQSNGVSVWISQISHIDNPIATENMFRSRNHERRSVYHEDASAASEHRSEKDCASSSEAELFKVCTGFSREEATSDISEKSTTVSEDRCSPGVFKEAVDFSEEASNSRVSDEGAPFSGELVTAEFSLEATTALPEAAASGEEVVTVFWTTSFAGVYSASIRSLAIWYRNQILAHRTATRFAVVTPQREKTTFRGLQISEGRCACRHARTAVAALSAYIRYVNLGHTREPRVYLMCSLLDAGICYEN